MELLLKIWGVCSVLNITSMAIIDGKRGTRNIEQRGIAAIVLAPLVTLVILGTFIGRALK